jgi:hypothetical protein
LQLSPVVHVLPSLHVVPSATAFALHLPVAGAHTGALQLPASTGGHATTLAWLTWHMPAATSQ